jgi:hypothetical protein
LVEERSQLVMRDGVEESRHTLPISATLQVR